METFGRICGLLFFVFFLPTAVLWGGHWLAATAAPGFVAAAFAFAPYLFIILLWIGLVWLAGIIYFAVMDR